MVEEIENLESYFSWFPENFTQMINIEFVHNPQSWGRSNRSTLEKKYEVA